MHFDHIYPYLSPTKINLHFPICPVLCLFFFFNPGLLSAVHIFSDLWFFHCSVEITRGHTPKEN